MTAPSPAFPSTSQPVQGEPAGEAADSARRMASRFGFWSAAMTAVLAAVHCGVGVATPPRSGPFAPAGTAIAYPYTDVAAFVPGDYVWLYPGLLLAPVFVALMASVHYYAADDRKVFSLAGLSFALVYATVIITDYFIQLTVIAPSLSSGEAAGLSLFTQYNPHGIFIALEAIGYSMMSTALFFAAAAFSGGRLDRAIRWLFVADFVLAIVFAVALSLLKYDIVAFEVAILTMNWTVLIISGVLLSVLFRRAGTARPEIRRL